MIIPGVVIFNIVLFDIWKQKNGLMRNPMKISYDELIFYQIETIFNPSENTQNKLNPKFYENVHEEIIMIFFFLICEFSSLYRKSRIVGITKMWHPFKILRKQPFLRRPNIVLIRHSRHTFVYSCYKKKWVRHRLRHIYISRNFSRSTTHPFILPPVRPTVMRGLFKEL